MDVYYSFDGELYCWNAEKAAANVSKHGVTFEQACEVFVDDLLLLEDATAGDEARSVAIGMTLNAKLECVVHLVREDEVTRIISAREATANERKRYEND